MEKLHYIPEIWSGRTLAKFYQAANFGEESAMTEIRINLKALDGLAKEIDRGINNVLRHIHMRKRYVGWTADLQIQAHQLAGRIYSLKNTINHLEEKPPKPVPWYRRPLFVKWR